MEIFNFFEELKSKCHWPKNLQDDYNIVNIGGKIVYVEGQKGLLGLSSNTISLKLSGSKTVEIKGENMHIVELTHSTITITGKIYKVEVF